MKKKTKNKKIIFDGIGPKDIKQIRIKLRQIWSWSQPRKLVVKRCSINGGEYSRCEKCKRKCAKVYVDHIERVGDVDEGFIKRLWVPSKYLQGLCKKCHAVKTRDERRKAKNNDVGDFY